MRQKCFKVNFMVIVVCLKVAVFYQFLNSKIMIDMDIHNNNPFNLLFTVTLACLILEEKKKLQSYSNLLCSSDWYFLVIRNVDDFRITDIRQTLISRNNLKTKDLNCVFVCFLGSPTLHIPIMLQCLQRLQRT